MRWLIALVVVAIPSQAVAQSPSELLKAWDSCLLDAVRLFAKGTDEPADVIASGAFGACEAQENTYLTRTMVLTDGGSPDEYFRMSDDMRKRNRDRIITEVLSIRVKPSTP